MNNAFEQARIEQLISTYGPDESLRIPLDFGDFLSLLWRLDVHADHAGKRRYYRQCLQALSSGIGLKGRSIMRLIDLTQPGDYYAQLPNAPYRGTTRLVDAQDRKAAIAELVKLRDETLRIGTRQEAWDGRWPGSGIVTPELRERVFAVLFTAVEGQFMNFGRLLLVVDIVLGNLLLGMEPTTECPLQELIANHGYPNPADERIRHDFFSSQV